MVCDVFSAKELTELAKKLFQNERKIDRLDGWFLIKEGYEKAMADDSSKLPHVIKTAKALAQNCENIPIYLDESCIFAGTQRDAFAKSYALINPNFKVNSFNGYCDPTDVFDEIEPNEIFTAERIEKVRAQTKQGAYVKKLRDVYSEAENDTKEVCYFIEQVTGHIIPDFRFVLSHGLAALKREISANREAAADEDKNSEFDAMLITIDAVLTLTERYIKCAENDAKNASDHRREQLELMIAALKRVPLYGAETLFEAVQAYILLWQVMCMEQAPNPFAFSVGNADRIFEPFRAKEGLSREYAAGLFEHFLVFFNVGDRSWAISQNLIMGGRDKAGEDLTNLCSLALMDAFFAMNLPQPILSVKLHKNTPNEFYEELGKFLFTPGCLTPSFFNDDSIFEILKENGFDEDDIQNYAVAGCQEPLIMGLDNGNTTNSWLNLPKILEITINDGISTLTGSKLGASHKELGAEAHPLYVLSHLRPLFYKHLEQFVDRMVHGANGATEAVSYLPVPFLSCFMGGAETGIDMRDVERQGTKYNGSGCLIHGLTVIADSFIAIDDLLDERPEDAGRLIRALQENFQQDEDLRQYLLKSEKFGNNHKRVDDEAVLVANRVSDMIRAKTNQLGNAFRPDFSSPSTHLIYGNHVGAMPSGRYAKGMLSYGIDPLYGDAQQGLGFRVLSTRKLPYGQFNGGYASHFGLDPKYFKASALSEKGLEFKEKIIKPLFSELETGEIAPFYLYVNITTAETLRKILSDPAKYVPNGVYIMRIHGTFVNFLDLSPEIQEDIILRLDHNSTTC